ncbi:MAG TPA: hypothetical protein VF062_12935, partial [Candidatus Limnocylindrales bacterium]
GMLDAWAEANFTRYAMRDAPIVAMTTRQHDITRSLFSAWYQELRAAQGVGPRGTVDWTRVSAAEVRAFSDRMFDAAGIPANVVREYYRQWAIYERTIR